MIIFNKFSSSLLTTRRSCGGDCKTFLLSFPFSVSLHNSLPSFLIIYPGWLRSAFILYFEFFFCFMSVSLLFKRKTLFGAALISSPLIFMERAYKRSEENYLKAVKSDYISGGCLRSTQFLWTHINWFIIWKRKKHFCRYIAQDTGTFFISTFEKQNRRQTKLFSSLSLPV